MLAAPDNLDPGAVALFLDIDGTLLEIRANPADVVADAELLGLLEACCERLGGALSLISGRTIETIDRIFAPAVFPAAGAHGSELRFAAGDTQCGVQIALPPEVIAEFEAFAARDAGLLVEKKRGGITLHFRRAPQLEHECRELADTLMAQLGEDFRLIAGKMVLEIAPSTHHKGSAIMEFLEHAPFAGRTPVFVGDDVTDEDGFRAVNQRGGISIRVGDTAGSAADHRLADVAAVRPWLRAAILGAGNRQRTGVHAS